MGDVLSINRTPKDFVAKTRHLSVEDRGAYQEILDQIVILGQDVEPPSLPDDDRFVANLLGWSVKKWKGTKLRLCHGDQAVLIVEAGRISQTRIVQEIEAARVRIAGASKAGNASAAARKALRERMSNGRTNVRTTDVPTSVVREGQRSVNADPNGSSTSHESRVTKEEEPVRETAGARGAVHQPDFTAAERVSAKLDASALRTKPSLQIVVAWLGEFDEELISETLVDCEPSYRGKNYQYLESILTTRRDDPSQRPGQRRAREQHGTRTGGNGRSATLRNGKPRPVDFLDDNT